MISTGKEHDRPPSNFLASKTPSPVSASESLSAVENPHPSANTKANVAAAANGSNENISTVIGAELRSPGSAGGSAFIPHQQQQQQQYASSATAIGGPNSCSAEQNATASASGNGGKNN